MKWPFAFLLFSFSALGTDYYVRTDGNDGNAGTANNAAGAWLTVQHAADTINGGDAVYVQPGTYAESVTINHGDGSAGNYKSFVAQGAVNVSQFTIQDRYCWLQGLRIYNETTNVVGLKLDPASDDAVITNCTIQVRGTGIQSTTTISGFPTNCRIDHCIITNCQYGIYLFGPAAGPGFKVYTNTVVDPREWKRDVNSDVDYMRLGSGGNCEFIGNLCYGATTNTIDTSGSDYPHIDGLMAWAFSGSVFAITNMIFANNILLDCMTGIMFQDDYSLGCGNNVFTNNVIGRGLGIIYTGQLNGQSPFNVQDQAGNTIIENNTWFDMGNGALFTGCTNVLVTNNISVDCQNGSKGYAFNAGSGDYNDIHPTASANAGPHDITGDPLFVNAASPLGADGLPWTADDGLRLQSTSPCIGTGANGVDMGAYAYERAKAILTGNARISGNARIGH